VKQIIEEVLRAEEKVAAMLGQARDKASEIGRSADKDISERMNDARQKALEMVRAAVEDAKKEAERTRQQKLEQADKEKGALLNNNRDAIDNLVDNICNVILTTECDKDAK
jgi:vacuolar-type H+-ATPase subunit H